MSQQTRPAVSFASSTDISQLPDVVQAPRIGRLQRIFAFPNPVNEHAARFTAGIVVALALVAVVARLDWLVASLEAFIGLCVGCVIFGLLQRRGLIPASACEECANFSLRKR